MICTRSNIVIIWSSRLWLSLVIPFVSCGPRQSNDDILTPNFSQEEQRILIPGTHCSIIPPKGFHPASGSIGLEGPYGALMTIMDFAGGNYYRSITTFSRQTLEAAGAPVLDFQELKVDGYPARYSVVRYNDDMSTFMILFGDTTFYVMASGTFPAANEKAQQRIKESLLSFVYNKAHVIDTMAIANFTVSENNSNFKFKAYSGGMYAYSFSPDQLSTKKDSEDIAFIIILSLPHAEDEDFPEFLKQRIEKNGLMNGVIRRESSESVNGYQTYQLEVQGTIQDKPTLIHLTRLSNGKNDLLIQGFTTSDYQKRVMGFNEFIQAVSFKP